MRPTILVHNNKIHLLSEITTLQPKGKSYYSIQYYQAISKDDIYSIREDLKGFYIKTTHYINDDMDFSAYKDKMTETEIQEFYAWWQLNELGIENGVEK